MRFDDNRKVARLLVGAGGLAYFIWAYLFVLRIPPLAKFLAASASVSGQEDRTYMLILCAAEFAGLMLGIAIFFYIAICVRVGRGMSFCRENTRDLNRISVLLLIAAAVFIVLPLFVPFGEQSVLIEVIGFMIAAVAVLAWALGKLVIHAVALKEENDLTI